MRDDLEPLRPELGGPPDDDPRLAAELSVSDFTRRVKALLEGTFSYVRVHGEVVGVTRARSGHVYFTLKDEAEGVDAQVSVVLWRTNARRLRFDLESGLRIVVEGRVAVYEPRGTYQIVAEAIQPAGRGTLIVAFERLKRKLWKEGLFDPARKRPLPPFPRRIGIVTSPTGAAVHDVLRSIQRRFPAWVRILPVRVQGEGSAADIAAAFELLERQPNLVDVAIVTRGGGSLEDLWTFNEEAVARAVAASPVPTVSGVGHEVDVTLCDLVADVRAQTPTHAGELVVRDREDLRESLRDLRSRVGESIRRRWEGAWIGLRNAGEVLASRSPANLLARHGVEVLALGSALKKSLYNRLREWEHHLSLNHEKLQALSPLNVLKRGFSVVLTSRGMVVRGPGDTKPGEDLIVRLEGGELGVRVLSTRDSSKHFQLGQLRSGAGGGHAGKKERPATAEAPPESPCRPESRGPESP